MFRFLYHIKRSFILVFWEEEWLVGATPSILNFGSTGPRWSKIADFQPIIARSASAVIPSERSSIDTNRKSPTRFPISLRWSSYVAPKFPKGGSKTPNGRFSSKIALHLKNVCYKVYSCDNCQRQSCRAFIGLTIHAKVIGGERPLLPEILGQTDLTGAKSPIFDLFSLVALQPWHLAKSSIITHRKSTTRFPMSPRWTLYVVPKSLQRVAQKRKVSKIWTISCDISETVRDRMSVAINH